MTVTHPEPTLLAAFSLGKLSDLEAESIEEHLGQCDSCCERIEELAAADSFASLVRACDPNLESPTVTNPSTVPAGFARNAGDIQEQTRRLAESLANHPRYAVRDLVGIGGMGAVYRASHRLMDRDVAVKVIRPEILTRPGAVERFHREVQTAAKLAHPNIVTAYDAEQVEGRHLLVMEFVEGRNLADEVKERGPLDAREACDYVRQAALGLQHAYEQGMVHRDIKPHNLMLTPTGQVKILDFGLASLIADEVAADVYHGDESSATAACLTEANAVIGTPDYMAPEQVTDAHAADIRSDLYGLGCTFYFLLTGRAPFADASIMEKIQAYRERHPLPVDQLRGNLPAEVASIVMKMMAKQPHDRYQTPAEVAVALAPYIKTSAAVLEPQLGASPSGSWFRNRTGMLLVAVLPILFAVAAALIYVETNKGTIVIETDDSDVQVIVQQDGERVAILDKKSSQQVSLDTGTYTVRLGAGADGLSMSLPEGSPFSLRRGEKKIVTVRRDRPTKANGADGPAALTEEIRFDPHEGYILALDFTPDGSRLVSGAAEQVLLWNALNGRLVRELKGHNRGVHAAVVLPDGERAATAGKGPAIVLSDLDTGDVIREFTGHTGFVECLAVSPDGARLASGSSNWVRKERGDRTVRVWDVESGKELWHAEIPAVSSGTGAVHAVLFTPDGRRLISAHHGSKDTISVWDATTGELLRRFSGQHSSIKCAAISPDGRTLATGHEAVRVQQLRWDDPANSVLRLWDVETGRELRRFVGHTGGLQAVDFSPDGTRLLSCSGAQFLNDAYHPHPSRDNTLRVWEVASGRELFRQPLPGSGIFAIFSPDGGRIASSSDLSGQFLLQIWGTP